MNELQTAGAILTPDKIKILSDAGVIPGGTPPAQIALFAEICSLHRLSPFKKQIYLVGYGGQYTPIVGIDGLREKAARTGRFAGRDNAMFDLQADGSFKTAAQLKAEGKAPTTATVTVYALVGGQRCPFTKTVVFGEYSTGKQKWATMPFNMIEKCAEAAALRMAFSDEVAGLHIAEEMAAFEDATIQARQADNVVEVDADAIFDKITDAQTLEELMSVYKANLRGAKSYPDDVAAMFTERKEQILDELQRAGKV